MKDTLPSMKAITDDQLTTPKYLDDWKALPKLTSNEIQLVISLRQLLAKGYTKEQIQRLLPLIRTDNL